MANTLVRIRRSSVTPAPANGALTNGELAYSHNSDKLFIGNTTGGIIEIGGRYWVNAIVSAFTTANAAAAGSLDTSARVTGNLAFEHANQAFAKANTANITADLAFTHANQAFAVANTSGDEAEAAFLRANLVFVHANAAFTSANAGLASASAGQATANAAFERANLAHAHANAAFATANAALPAAGGTITGDLVVSGNITVSGLTTYTNTQTLLIGDNIFVLNADLPSNASPSENAGFIVDRGNQSNVSIQWLEAANGWYMNANNSPFHKIASNVDVEVVSAVAVAGIAHANAAFVKANTANSDAIAAFVTANQAFSKANTANTDAIAAFLTANIAFAHANAAFASANAGQASANAGQATANAAFNKANTANNDAIAAFLTANLAYAMANTANGRGANASFISTGTLAVAYGGTGLNSVATNGILYGQGTAALGVATSATEGHVLQIADNGVPVFGFLDGGTF